MHVSLFRMFYLDLDHVVCCGVLIQIKNFLKSATCILRFYSYNISRNSSSGRGMQNSRPWSWSQPDSRRKSA